MAALKASGCAARPIGLRPLESFTSLEPAGAPSERMMRQGMIGAVLDFSTIEVSNDMPHALLAGGADRLTVAGGLGLPQVLCPGALEVFVFNETENVRRLQATRQGGYDSYAVAGEPFHDPEADAAFVSELRNGLPKNIAIRERDLDINHPAFATEAATALIGLMQQTSAAR